MNLDLKVDEYKSLLESTNAIPWKIDWDTKRFVYIGPQIERLMGWPRGDWKTVDNWIERIHPLDRDNVTNFCGIQSQLGLDHEAIYRALRKDGSHIWIRDVVHVERAINGGTKSLMGFMIIILDQSAVCRLQLIAKSNPFNEAQIIRIGLKITPAEMKLAKALVRGQKVHHYATTNNLSINTVRSQLRSLFAKFEVDRQVDLVRKLLEFGLPSI